MQHRSKNIHQLKEKLGETLLRGQHLGCNRCGEEEPYAKAQQESVIGKKGANDSKPKGDHKVVYTFPTGSEFLTFARRPRPRAQDAKADL